MRISWLLWIPLVLAMLNYPAASQQSKDKTTTEAKAPVYVPPSARLAAAKTALVKNAGGSEIPFNVVTSAMEGWGRYRLVDSPAEADLIIEVSSPDEGGGVSVSSNTRTGNGGRTEQSTTTSRNLSSGAIKLAVYDGRTHVALWTASEQAKSALRQKAREDNLVQAAGRLVTKFRERVEPPPGKSN